ncbi:intradiol ring-cleavage dioxygenase [Paradevosia shaoguanensis]|uniref:Intradiol ring-cleavage dioxygenase n=1 Tax=Paradevosia shaoguanensis TaxID=1335043 RepID=A0AA41UCD8_9HYPH|nr:intradiol ring-cleavage dioxygenase [Paradevosia shaoguanensis]MCF1743659.1 intradiol ring-cleavage dioxygenase [Paradevosia shaoguanensis]MCI0128142.1 intradiol ring-cleavage dioxygenase [Paradevosia shaoguanensis]
MPSDDHSPARLSRRGALSLIAVTAAGGTLVPRQAFAQEAGTNADTAGLLPGADVCVITPEVTEGPYYFDPALERQDVTEGRPGVRTQVRLQVVDAQCKPMAGARVDIWHADATGIFSGYANQPGGIDTTGQTFMRGTQMTGENGVAEFATVYPGWYRGRTTHIHFKVFLDETNVLTGQLFFPDALSEFVYLNVAPYSDRKEQRDTINSTDGIAAQATRASFAYVKELADAYLVAMIIGVDPNAGSGGASRGMGGPPPGASGSGGSRSLVPGVSD